MWNYHNFYDFEIEHCYPKSKTIVFLAICNVIVYIDCFWLF